MPAMFIKSSEHTFRDSRLSSDHSFIYISII